MLPHAGQIRGAGPERFRLFIVSKNLFVPVSLQETASVDFDRALREPELHEQMLYLVSVVSLEHYQAVF